MDELQYQDCENLMLMEYENQQDSNQSETEGEVNLCRTCLMKDVELKSMFEEYTYIPVFLMSFASVETPTPNDRLPGYICMKCIEQINQIYNFRKQIETADFALRKVLSEQANCAEEEEFIDEQLETEDYSNLDDTLIDPDDIDIEENLNVSQQEPTTDQANASTKLLTHEKKKDEKKSATLEFPDIEKIPLRTYKCDICKSVFNSSRLLKLHREDNEECNPFQGKVKSEETITCPDCVEVFENEFDFNIHASVHKAFDNFVCVQCMKDCGNRKSLKRHVKTHYKPFKCKECQQQFSEVSALTRHYKRHLGIEKEKKFSCSMCEQQFYDKYALDVHVRAKHTGERPFVCPECGCAFSDKRLLNSHLKIHNPNKEYICDTCNKTFTHRSTLIGHLRTHTGIRPYICIFCQAAFKQKTHLNAHVRQHTNSRPYQCKICTASFATSNTLKSHERTHSGAKPFSCEFCKKQFARRDLRAHYSTHTGQKDFICQEADCNKGFATKSQLNNHHKIKHSDASPFICSVVDCGRKFGSGINLQKHLKAHEKSKIKQPTASGSNSSNIPHDMDLPPFSVPGNLLIDAVYEINDLDELLKH